MVQHTIWRTSLFVVITLLILFSSHAFVRGGQQGSVGTDSTVASANL